jgi:predicted XRE-type DNA-binding protein
MVDVVLLRTYMHKARVTQKQLAKLLEIGKSTRSERLSKRVFRTKEAVTLTALLAIEDPVSVFLNPRVT